MADTVVRFQLDAAGEAAPAQLVYRPWGTRTLKVLLSTSTALPTLRLRPKTTGTLEQDFGIFRGFADDSRALVLSWGGGHEQGPCVRPEDFLKAFEHCAPMPAGGTNTVFFNLSHVGPDVPATATLTLEAFEDATGRVHATLPVQLVAPATLPADLIRMAPAGTGRWAPTAGAALPAYDSRWWPDPDVTYVPATPPPLSVERSGNSLRLLWEGADGPVTTLVDLTEPSVLDAGEDALAFELLAFAGRCVALRIWFFWLDKRLGPEFFVGRHEVPDVERFDIVIRTVDGRAVLACSDAHWREVWGEVADAPALPLGLTLGLSTEARLKLLQKVFPFGGDHGAATGHVTKYDPRPYIEARAVERSNPATQGRQVGTEAHLPSLVNVAQDEANSMISSDVRLS